MGQELPTRDVLEAQIAAINRGFLGLVEKAKLQSTSPLEELKEEIATEETKIGDFDPETTSAGFWKHYIGSQITAAKGEIDFAKWKEILVDEGVIRKAQRETVGLTRQWVNLRRERTPLEEESTSLFLQACSSFDWAEHKDLFLELRELVVALGNHYMRLEGEIPFGNPE